MYQYCITKNSSYKEIEETTIQYKEQQKYSVQSLIYIITGQVWLLPRPSCWAQVLNGREDALWKTTLDLS